MDKTDFDFQFYLATLRTADAVGMAVAKKDDLARVMFDEFGGYCRVLGEPEYKPFTHVLFYAGYAKDRQVAEKKIESIFIGKPQKGMCPDEWLNKDVFIIKFK